VGAAAADARGATVLADSKALTEEQRMSLFARLKSSGRIGWAVRQISAEEISAKMLLRTPISLNEMSHDCAINMAKRLIDRGLNLSRLIVDTVGDPDRYRARIHEALGGRVDVVVEKKADANYAVVSAASIAAKCTRDASVERGALQASSLQPAVTLTGEPGSGYPSDPLCRQWMKENVHPVFGWASPVRFSWGTTDEFLASAVKVDFGEDESGGGDQSWKAPPPAITSFFASKRAGDGDALPLRKQPHAMSATGAVPARTIFR
jgi:ribonuclease H2 subunit A